MNNLKQLLESEEKEFEEKFGKLLFTLDKHFALDANSRLEKALPDWLRSHDARLIAKVVEMVENFPAVEEVIDENTVKTYPYLIKKADLLTSLQGE